MLERQPPQEFKLEGGKSVPVGPEDKKIPTRAERVASQGELIQKRDRLVAEAGAAIVEEREGYVKLSMPFLGSATPRMMGPTGPNYLEIIVGQ